MNRNHPLMHRLEQNDATLNILQIGGTFSLYGNDNTADMFYSTDSGDFSRLGDYIGENTRLTKLVVAIRDGIALDVTNNEFYDGLKRNSSIYKLEIDLNNQVIVEGGVGHQILDAYQENNNLTELSIDDADLQNGGEHVIAETLRRCTNLKHVDLLRCNITDGQSLSIIVESVREHRSLKHFGLFGNIIRNAGCEAIATLVRDPGCNLHLLDLRVNSIGNEGTTILANGLLKNKKLKKLWLHGNQIDQGVVVDIFARLICNVSSINNTYSSNHTLRKLFLSTNQHYLGEHLASLLKMNKGKNKSHVAIKKILKYHPNIDMEPFFEWNMEGEGERDLKALPYVVAWFERAEEAVAGDDGGEGYNIGARRLSSMYQFAKAMPLLFVPVPHDKEGDNKRKRA